MRTLLALIAAVALGGCGSDGETSTDGPAADDVLVEYSRGGGIAVSLVQLTVEADGDAEIGAGYTEADLATEEIQLTEAELTELSAAVEAADLDAVEAGAGGCADCYIYGITTADGTVELSDADFLEGGDAVVPNEVLELLEQLKAIVEANPLPPPSPPIVN